MFSYYDNDPTTENGNIDAITGDTYLEI